MLTVTREKFVLDELQNGQVAMTLHNVRLTDVSVGADGIELLHLETEGGQRGVVQGVGQANEWRRQDVGKVGMVRRAQLPAGVPTRACQFYPYTDQSLRRAPELDCDAGYAEGRNPNVIGWRCDTQPKGFLAPLGLTPGEGGGFVSDHSESVTLRVPHEFVRECERYGMSPAEMLRAFACDAAGIINLVRCPRADGFASNGSDERDLADAWMERAFAGKREEAERLAARREAAEQDQEDRDNFGYLLTDWQDAGGDKAELFDTVEQLIRAKDAGRGEGSEGLHGT